MTNNKPVDHIAAFQSECESNIRNYSKEENWKSISNEWMQHAFDKKYMYNFTSLGRPIIQNPEDMVAFQELVWSVKPDLIIEMGVAHGGSLIQSAAMLAQLDLCEAIEAGSSWNPKNSDRRVLGVDIDIRKHNRDAIEKHPMSSRIEMIEGSSIDSNIIKQVHSIANGYSKIMLCLDSHHTYAHVLAELNAYAELVSVDSYCIVFDTVVEEMPVDMFPDRPWEPGDGPKTAVIQFLTENKNFEVDDNYDQKLLLSCCPHGYLRRIG